MSHTPGPWLREGDLVYTLQHYGWRRGVEEFENRFTCRVSGCPRGAKDDEVRSNAILIQSAPDLLQALEAVEKLFATPGYYVGTRDGADPLAIDATMILVAQAVRAAKGEA